MNKRRIASYPVAGQENKFIDVELYYSKGGMNYFTSSVERRGIYVSVTPVERSADGRWTSVTALSGVKALVAECARFSQKQLDSTVVDPELQQKLIDHVLAKNGIVLKKTGE